MNDLGPFKILKSDVLCDSSVPYLGEFKDYRIEIRMRNSIFEQPYGYQWSIIDFLYSWTLFLFHFGSLADKSEEWFIFFGYSDSIICKTEDGNFCFSQHNGEKLGNYPCWELITQSMKLLIAELRDARLSGRLPNGVTNRFDLTLNIGF